MPTSPPPRSTPTSTSSTAKVYDATHAMAGRARGPSGAKPNPERPGRPPTDDVACPLSPVSIRVVSSSGRASFPAWLLPR